MIDARTADGLRCRLLFSVAFQKSDRLLTLGLFETELSHLGVVRHVLNGKTRCGRRVSVVSVRNAEVKLSYKLDMQDASIDFVCVVSSTSGSVFGVAVDGVAVRLENETVRRLTQTTRHAVDFDECEIQSIYLPSSFPSFPVTGAAVSDDDHCILLLGQADVLHFGVLHLDRSSTNYHSRRVPYTEARPTEVEVLRVRWFPGCQRSLAVLRRDTTLSVYDVSKMAYPECVYRLKRDIHGDVGISSTRLPSPVDFVFLGRTTWGWTSALVLYDDGAVYLLSPIRPVGNVKALLLASARRRPISSELLKGLLMETMGQHLDDAPQMVPNLQGPLNQGLASFREDAFARRKAASAVALSFAYCTDGVATVTIGTSNGRLYSHAMLTEPEPQCIPPSEATVTTMGVRLCIPDATDTALRLMETIELKERRFKEVMSIDQDPGHPEILYVCFSGDLMRVRISWADSMISGSISNMAFGRSQVWSFDQHAQFLGSFQSLDTSVAVFRMGHRTCASILHPQSLFMSALEHLPLEKPLDGPRPNQNDDAVPLEDAIGELQGPGTLALKEAFQKYCYLMLETTEFDTTFLKLEDITADYEETTTALESKLQSLIIHTSNTTTAIKKMNRDAWSNAAVLRDLIVIQRRLDEMTERY